MMHIKWSHKNTSQNRYWLPTTSNLHRLVVPAEERRSRGRNCASRWWWASGLTWVDYQKLSYPHLHRLSDIKKSVSTAYKQRERESEEFYSQDQRTSEAWDEGKGKRPYVIGHTNFFLSSGAFEGKRWLVRTVRDVSSRRKEALLGNIDAIIQSKIYTFLYALCWGCIVVGFAYSISLWYFFFLGECLLLYNSESSFCVWWMAVSYWLGRKFMNDLRKFLD